jgi:hypothetical protein
MSNIPNATKHATNQRTKSRIGMEKPTQTPRALWGGLYGGTTSAGPGRLALRKKYSLGGVPKGIGATVACSIVARGFLFEHWLTWMP